MTTPPDQEPSQPRKRRPQKEPAKPIADLTDLLLSPDSRFVSPEHPHERRSRLAIKEEQARHEIWRDKVTLYACLVGLAVLTIVSLVFLFFPGQTSEAKTWAAASLSAIVSGVVNYSIGRAGKAN